MAHVEALTTAKMAGREAGSEGERLAAGYIAGVLRAAGIAPSDQPVDMADGRKSLNVVGVIRGAGERAGEHVVLGAHMDHLGTRPEGVYHGAEDNASGVAVVLEIGEALQRQRALLGRSVVLVFFGAEEVGLWGSRAFAQKPTVSPLAAMVNVDMIGREFIDQSRFAAVKPIFGIHSREGIGILGTKGRPHLRAIVDAACAKEGLTAWAPEDLPQAVAEWVERQTRGRGDNHSFEEVGVPALFYGSGESDDYHQPSDTPEKLDPLLMQVRARAILHTVVALTTADLASPR
jgi:Zn-dependent M28 family amino/carboxypeptidase